MRPRGAADGSNDRACRGPKANSSRNADPRQPQNTKTRKLRGKPALETVSSREFFSCLFWRTGERGQPHETSHSSAGVVWPHAPVWISFHPSTHTFISVGLGGWRTCQNGFALHPLTHTSTFTWPVHTALPYSRTRN